MLVHENYVQTMDPNQSCVTNEEKLCTNERKQFVVEPEGSAQREPPPLPPRDRKHFLENF